MLDTLTRNIIYGTTYCALEHLGSKEHSSVRVLLTNYKKGEVSILYNEEVASITEINHKKQLPRHAQLIVNNEQVLSKEVLVSSGSNDSSLLYEAFPGLNTKDFYYEVIPLKDTALVFICRKKYVADLIEQYEQLGIIIRNWRLGVSIMKHFEVFLEDLKTLRTNSLAFDYREGLLESITPSEEGNRSEAYHIQDMEVDSRYLNTLGIVLENFSVDSNAITTDATDQIQAQERLYKQYRFYSIGLPVAIGTLLLIFLVNFFIYNHYFTQVENMEVLGNTNSIQRKLLQKKDSVVDQKQQLFEDVIASSSSSSSYIVDQLIAEMPSTILLERLTYQPLSKSIKQNKPLAIRTNLVEVAGTTSQNADLSQWISAIEALEFVQGVSIKDLDKGGRLTNFKLTLNLGG